MARRFERVLVDATDQTLEDPYWEAILECVDLICCGGIPVEQALRLIQKRYHHEHPGVAYHALLVLEACVKNCGTKLHNVVATNEFMDDLKNIATRDAQDKVTQKVLELLQSWAMAFRDRPEYRIFVDTYSLMKTSGYQFPGIQEGDAMFAAESAPDLVDVDSCYRCRVKFGRLTRKHHCRACRQTFCRKCSNKAFFPQFGVEKKLRVCKMCFDERQKEDAQTTKDTRSERTASPTTNGDDDNVRIQDLAEEHDEEWHLELTISHSKAEAELQCLPRRRGRLDRHRLDRLNRHRVRRSQQRILIPLLRMEGSR